MKKKKLTNQDADKLYSNVSLRELEVVSRYYDVDMEAKVLTVPVKIEKASDLFYDDSVVTKTPLFKQEFLEPVAGLVHSLPDGFNISYKITVKDYENYDPEELMHSFRDTLEIFNYNASKDKQKSNVKMAMLIFVGTFIFTLLFYLCSLNIFGDKEINHNIIHEIIYTIACVLLWEGVYILFLPEDTYNGIKHSVLNRISDVRFYDKNDKLLVTNSLDDIKRDWIHETKSQKRWKNMLLVGATGVMIFAGIAFGDCITFGQKLNTFNIFTILAFAIYVVFVIIAMLTGLSAISFYTGKGKLRLNTGKFACIGLILTASVFVVNLLETLKNGTDMRYYLITESIVLLLFIFVFIAMFKLMFTFREATDYKNKK